MVAFEAVIGSGGVAVVIVSGREDAGGVGLGRGGGRRRGPDGGEAAEKGGKSRAAIMEDAGGERREIV